MHEGAHNIVSWNACSPRCECGSQDDKEEKAALKMDAADKAPDKYSATMTLVISAGDVTQG